MTPSAVDNSLTVVGMYARYSNDGLQRDSSIEDQFRTCSEAAEEKGYGRSTGGLSRGTA